jgi:hypothetical protein
MHCILCFQLFAALARGCSQNIVTLDLSRNIYSTKKSARDAVPLAVKDFFGTAAALQSVNLASCRLPSEALKQVI